MINKKLLAASVLLAAFGTQTQAQTIAADGKWYAFDVDEEISGGLGWIDLDNNPLTFNFTLTQDTVLDVVDAGFAGDILALDFTGPINFVTRPKTSAVANYIISGDTVNDFEAAFADPNFSKFSITLLPGTYSLTGELIQSALDNGTPINATFGAVRLTTAAVPLPAVAWLYVTGTAMIGLVSRRRKSK